MVQPWKFNLIGLQFVSLTFNFSCSTCNASQLTKAVFTSKKFGPKAKYFAIWPFGSKRARKLSGLGTGRISPEARDRTAAYKRSPVAVETLTPVILLRLTSASFTSRRTPPFRPDLRPLPDATSPCRVRLLHVVLAAPPPQIRPLHRRFLHGWARRRLRRRARRVEPLGAHRICDWRPNLGLLCVLC